MNILHLTPWQEPCGIAGYAADLVGALNSCGVRNDVHALNRRGRLYPLAEEVRADLDSVCRRARGYDLVHIQHEFSFFCDSTHQVDRGIDHFGHLLAGLRRAGKPVAVTFHTEPDFPRPLRSLGKGFGAFARFCRDYQLGRRWKRRVRPFFRKKGQGAAFVHTAKGRAALVESGFDSSRVHKTAIGLTPRAARVHQIGRARARGELGYPADAVVLSLFGFISGYKGHELAVAALRHLPPHFQLAVIGGPHPQGGDGTLDAILNMVADHPELKDRLRVTGFASPQTIDLYHAATDICLAPYRDFNSSSAAITWALTSGRPVIASKIPSFLEMQDEAECLLLFTKGAEHELAWQVQRLATDPRLQAELVRNAAAYAERHRWANVADQVLDVYASLLGKGRPALSSAPRYARAA